MSESTGILAREENIATNIVGAPPAYIDTVSDGDLVHIEQGAEMTRYETVAEAETTITDMTEVCSRLDVLNTTLALLTFFTIFVWVEQKISSGVRRIMKHE